MPQKLHIDIVADFISDALISIDINSNIVYVNKAAETLFGWTQSELLSMKLTELMPEEYRSRHLSSLNKYLVSGEKSLNWNSIELVGLKKDNSIFSIETSFSEYRKGGERFFLGLIRDISVKKALEADIIDSRERYKNFIKGSSEGIWRFELYSPINISLPVNEQIDIMYSKGYLSECNDAMAKMYGYNIASDIVGATLGDMIPRSKDSEEYLTSFIANEYKLVDTESIEKDKNGKSVYFINTFTGYIENGLLYRAWGVQRDITEQMKRQQELEHVNNELEHFTYSVSHDLQEPIRVIHSYGELLQKNISNPKLIEAYIDNIVDTSKRMEVFVESLLKYAQAGKQVKENVIPTNEAVKIAIDNLTVAIKETGAKIIYNDLLNVDVDSVSLIQVFQNLLSNSIKFHKDGVPPVITIGNKLMYNFVQFSITDNGIGIASKHKDVLFNMFYKIPDKGVYKGSGIGLTIVKKILNSSGGRVTIVSEDGEGTTIYFTLPKGDI